MEEIKRPNLQCNIRVWWEHETNLAEDLTGRHREGKITLRPATLLGKKKQAGAEKDKFGSSQVAPCIS